VGLSSVQSLCFLVQTNPCKKIDEIWQQFFEHLILNICQGYKGFSSVWLWRLILRQCTHVIFLFHFDLVEEVLVVGELCLFRRLFVISTACVDPLVWWGIQEIQFPYVNFLAK
jgi:hypothetical protein